MRTCGLKEIAEEIASSTNLSPEVAERGLFAAIDLFTERLREGARLTFREFAELTPTGAAGEALPNGQKIDVPGPEVAEALSHRATCSPSEADALLAEFLNVLRSRLLEGDKIQLDNFISLRIVEEKARIGTDKATGQKLILPARKVISFATSQNLRQTLGEDKALAFQPHAPLRDRIATLKTSAILLAVPERDFFARTLEYHFGRAGWKVQTCTTVREALDLIKGGDTYLIILDHNVKDSQKLAENVKAEKETSLVPLIMMLPRGSDPKKTSEFRICGDEGVIEPFEVKALLTLAEAELARSAEEEVIFQQEILFQFPTTDASIDRANELAANLFEKSGLDDEGQVALCAAFREAVGNAAQHGNRHRADLSIEVLYLLDKEKITVAVTDMGKGFDHRMYTQRGAGGDALAAARERHQEGRLGGLGIMLMMKCVDVIEYNEVGNSLTLTKGLTSGGPRP